MYPNHAETLLTVLFYSDLNVSKYVLLRFSESCLRFLVVCKINTALIIYAFSFLIPKQLSSQLRTSTKCLANLRLPMILHKLCDISLRMFPGPIALIQYYRMMRPVMTICT